MTLPPSLATGRWQTLSLAEQLAHAGGEVGRAFRWKDRDEAISRHAAERALELLDLTIADPRWRDRLKELARLREVLADALFGTNEYDSSPESLERYFTHFARMVRLRRSPAIAS